MLTRAESRLLDFESAHPRHDGAKEEALARELEMAPARYYQLLSRLISRADAVAYDPLLIHRVQRMWTEKSAA